MTQHSKIGEGVEAPKVGAGRPCIYYSGACLRCGRPYRPCEGRQSLAREPATADVGREALKPFAALADEWDRWQAKGSTSTPKMIQMSYGKVRFGLPEYQAARAALSRAAPSSKPAIAEGEVHPDYPAGAIENGREFLRRLGEYDCAAGAISMSVDYTEAVRCFEYLATSCAQLAALATTPPTTNDAIPAGMVSVETAREGCVGSMDPKRATYFLERFKREEKWLGPHEQWALDYTIRILAALSAAPSAPATEAGSCFLCAGKCRGHSFGKSWEPEPGSDAHVLGQIADAATLARNAADRLTEHLDKDDRRWQPTRAHYEGARNDLRAIERLLPATPTDQVKDAKGGGA